MHYIVVVFADGIGHTYQMNDKCDCFCNNSLPKFYSRLRSAKQRAHKLFNKYTTCNKVVVYKVNVQESFYRMWNELMRENIVYELKKEEK